MVKFFYKGWGCGQILGPTMTGRKKMSFTEKEKKRALQLYDETGSIAKVIHKLGYPSRQNMYTWIKNRDIEKKRKKYDATDSPGHRRHPSLEIKLEILHHYFSRRNK